MRLSNITKFDPRRDHGNIEELKKSIEEVGLICPLAVNENRELLAGRRRYQALKELGIEEVATITLSAENPLKAFLISLHENIKRKNLTDLETAMAVAEYDELKRRLEGERGRGNIGSLKQFTDLLHCGKSDEGWTEKRTAKDLGISQQAVSKCKEISRAVKKYPQLAKIKSGIFREKRLIELSQKTPNIPEDEFNVILADPPWRYEHSISDSRKVENKYPTLSLRDICAIPIQKKFADKAILFLWTPNPKLEEGLQVINAWGFKYRTNAVWVKHTIGMGYYFRQQHELILVGIKGEQWPPTAANKISSVIDERRKKHSEKPKIHSLIEKMYPNQKYLELFARQKMPGWESWGNECQ